jgi:Prenyltransferase and squalene oxidase repeat
MADALQRAGQFLHESGRDLDRALFDYTFSGAARDDVVSALASYQNADGGFHGLEVDIAAPDSNPFATELALQICIEADVPRDSEMLQSVVRYLEQTQDDEGSWRFSEGVYQHKLAPWFQAWEWPNLNPSCTTAGLLKQLGLGSPELHARVERLFERLAKVEDLTSDEFYGVRPYASYFLPELQHPQRELYLSGVLWWLIRQAENAEMDGNHFFQYAPRPDVYTARMLPQRILDRRLEMLAAEQQEDGGWPTPYDPRWRSTVSIHNLLTLRAFGKL